MDFWFSTLVSIFVFALGACIGSFLNVVIYRVPAGLSLLHPPSRCPHCLHRLQPQDNVPIGGWLWLQGRCRYCHQPIAPRYPLIEAATGLLFVGVFGVFGFSLSTIGYWVFFSWLLALSFIDLDTMTLPESLTRSGLLLGLVFQTALAWGMGWDGMAIQIMNGIVGAVVGIWLLDGLTIVGSAVLGQTAMGGGDAKLAAMLGAWLGWKLVLLAGFLACGIGALAGGSAIALGWLSRRQPMPFGPFLAIGAVVAAIWGEGLLQVYQQWFFPIALN